MKILKKQNKHGPTEWKGQNTLQIFTLGHRKTLQFAWGKAVNLLEKPRKCFIPAKTKRHLKILKKKFFINKGNWKIPDRSTCNLQGCKLFKENSCNSCGEIICSVSEKAKIEKQPKEGKVVFSWHFGYTQAKILSIKVKTLLQLHFF